jgi:predicted P-loop ATPase
MNDAHQFTLIKGSREEVEDKLIKTSKGSILATQSNLKIIFRNDPMIFEIFQINQFSGEMITTRPPPVTDKSIPFAPGPYPRQSTEPDAIRILAYVQRYYSSKFTKGMVTDCLMTEGEDRKFHPVCNWLDKLHWDGIPRLNRWLIMTFGVPDDEYHHAVASKLLIAAVRRVRQPGCKFDHMVVFEGGQGIGKSQSISMLFGSDWYTDQIADLLKKDAAIDLFGKWAIELSEIDHLVRSEVETVKAFLSRCTDRYRPPYGKMSVDFPRQCVFIGTTNSEEYLRDTTGNRRIWPVRCRSRGSADLEWLKETREQLWAEASHREATGETIYLDQLHLKEIASEIQSQRMIEDAWADVIRNYIQDKTMVSVPGILADPLQIPTRDWTKGHQMRIASILRAEGWSKQAPAWDSSIGKNVRTWRKDLFGASED